MFYLFYKHIWKNNCVIKFVLQFFFQIEDASLVLRIGTQKYYDFFFFFYWLIMLNRFDSKIYIVILYNKTLLFCFIFLIVFVRRCLKKYEFLHFLLFLLFFYSNCRIKYTVRMCYLYEQEILSYLWTIDNPEPLVLEIQFQLKKYFIFDLHHVIIDLSLNSCCFFNSYY